ncbi:MAG TPA: T9SS type A sorting domain-containing protein, partial [Niastella sp.]
VYDNQDFTSFKGTMLEGTAANNSRIDQNFGGDDVTFYTNSCPVVSTTFSVRYRLRRAFNNENVTFLVGGDDGYRFSLNGGASWVVQNWTEHNWTTTSYTTTLNGTYNMVLEFYEANGSNRVTFDMNAIVLPIELLRFNGNLQNNQAHLYWTTTLNSNTELFTIEKSANGSVYTTAGQVKASAGIKTATGVQYAFTDGVAFTGSQFYRLKMADQNGIVTYSEIITVRNNTNSELRIYPTVLHTGNQLVVESTKQQENITITITDMMGRPVMQQHLPVLNSQTTPIDLKNILLKGVYMVQVKNKEGVLLNQKIVVQ